MSGNTPAFPSPNNAAIGDMATGGHAGMSLRDYIAAQAITICIKDHSKTYSDWAQEAYALADAMLEARKVQSVEPLHFGNCREHHCRTA